MAWGYNGKGTVFHSQSNYPDAIQNYLSAVRLFEKAGEQQNAASIMGNVGVLFKEMNNLDSAEAYFEKGLNIHEKTGDKEEIARFLNNLGGVYLEQNRLDIAETAFMKCLLLTKNKHMEALVLRNLAELKVSKRAYKQALSYASRSLSLYQAIGEREGAADAYYQIAVVYEGDNNPDSAILYADKSLSLAKEIGFKRNIHNTYEVLAKAYAAKQYYKQAYRNSLLYSAYKDSLTGEEKLQEVAALKFRYELDKKQSQIELLTKDRLLREEEAKHQRQKIYVLLAGFVLVGLLALVFIRANLQKKKANKLLEKQKTEVQNTLKELKETQVQLVQREKILR
jgi:tetratricopeptide (TPR) repeat protein